MKVNKFTTLISAVMLASSPVAATFAATSPVMASSVKKSYKGVKVALKGQAALYNITLKGSKVAKIAPLKLKGRQLAYNAKKVTVFWKAKKGGHYYYFIGNGKVNKKPVFLAIKSNAIESGTKVTAKIPTLDQYAAYLDKKQGKRNISIPIKHLAFDGYTNGATIEETPYWNQADGGKFEKASDTLAKGTSLKIMFAIPDVLTNSDGQKADAYFADYNDKLIMVPAFTVKPDGAVKSQAEYESSLQNYKQKDKEYVDQQVKLAKEKLAKENK